MTRISCGFFLLDLSSTLGYQAVINRPLVILKLWDLHGNGSFCSLSVRKKKKKTFDVSAMYFFLILTSFTSLHVVFGEGSKNFTKNVKSLENYRKSLFSYWWFVYFESFYAMLSSFQWKDLSVSFFLCFTQTFHR